MASTFKVLALAALLAAPMPLAAQAGGAPGGREARTAGERAEGRSPLRFLLSHRAELALSADQLSQLEQIQARVEGQNRPLVEQLRAARPAEGQRARDLSEAERDAMRQKRDELRPLMRQLRENHRKTIDEVRTVLTDDQQGKLRELMREQRRSGDERDRGQRRERRTRGHRG